MPKYTFNGEPISEDFVIEAAGVEGLSVDEYVKQKQGLEFTPDPPVKGKPNGVAQTGATVTPQTGQAPESTDLGSIDGLLESVDIAIQRNKTNRTKPPKVIGFKTISGSNKPQVLEIDTITGIEKKKQDNATLDQAGINIWAYTPENLTALQSVDQEGALDIKSLTGLGGEYTSGWSGGFRYQDFANEVKLNGTSISDLQAIDINRAAQESYSSLFDQHGENLNQYVLNQGASILTGKDKELQELYSMLKTAAPKNKQEIRNKIEQVRAGETKEFYDINTGNIYSFDKLTEEQKAEEQSRNEKALEKAQTTELEDLQVELNENFANLLGISNRISQFSSGLGSDNMLAMGGTGRDEILTASQNRPTQAVSFIKGLFGSEETVEGDLNRIINFAETGVLPENISKIPGDHPLATAFNNALEDYVILNKAIQTNTDITSKKQEGFWVSAGQQVEELFDFSNTKLTPTKQFEINRNFVRSVESAGLGTINQHDLDESLSQNWLSVIGGGSVDLGLFAGELLVTKKLSGNTLARSFNYLRRGFNATKLAKSSGIARRAVNWGLSGAEEASTLTLLEQTKVAAGLQAQTTREQEYATRMFGFSLGSGNSLASGILRAIPAKNWFSPIIAQLNKSNIARNWQSGIVSGAAGSFSFEFARAAEALINPEQKGYGPNGESTYFEQSPEEFIKGYLAEYYKMRFLGAKSIFAKNGMVRAAQNDMRLLGLDPLYVRNAAKRTGFNAEELSNPTETTVDDINAARADQMQAIDVKLKTGQITEEQAKKQSDEANKDYNTLEAEAELNVAKKSIKAEDASALKPTDTNINILIQKLKKGEKLTVEDNNTFVNTPLPILYDRMGMDPQAKGLEASWNREFILEDILNNNVDFKAGYGTPEREASYKFLNEYFDIGRPLEALKKLKNPSQDQLAEITRLEKDLEAYKPGGYKYDRIQDQLNKYYLTQRQQNKAQAAEVLGATKEGESVSIKSLEEYQRLYEEKMGEKDDVRNTDGFYDPNNKVFYVNETVVKKTRNITVDKHETSHFVLRDSFKDKAGNVTEEGIKIIDEVLSELTPKQREVVQKRIDKNYRFDAEGNEKPKNEYYEEYLMALSDAIINKEIVFKENVGNAFEKFIPLLRKKGMPELELNADTGKNLFELIKSYAKGERAGIEAAKKISKAAEGVEVEGQAGKLSLTAEDSAKVNKIYEEQGIAGYEDILNLLKPTAKALARRFKDRPNYDEQLAIDAIMTGKRGMLDVIMDYNKKVEAGEQVPPLSGFLNKNFTTKDKGGFKRYIDAVEKVVGKEFTVDVSEAKGVVAEEAAEPTVTKEVRGPRKPSESTQYSNTVLTNAKVENKAQLEDKITKATQDAFKGQEITRFGETRNIPESVAKIYGEAFGVNPQTFVDKKRNYQKYDAEGLTRIKQFLIDNASADYARLPKTKDDFGKGTFIPNNVMNAMYTDGKLTGTLKDYIDLIKEKPTKPIYRDKVSQTIRGFKAIHIRNRMLEDLIPVQAERLRAGAKFSESGIGKKINKNLEKSGVAVLKRDPEGNKIFRDFAANILTKYLGRDADKITKPGDLAGAGNSAVGNRKTSGAIGRGFRFIGNLLKTQKFIEETKKALESGEVMDLDVLRKEIKQATQILSDQQVKDVIAATSSQTRASMKRNAENKDSIKRGRNLILNSLFEAVKEDINNLAPIRELLYNQNANSSFGRKFATVTSIEDNLTDKQKTWEEHVFQFGNWANRTLQAFSTKNKKILDGWTKWADENYYQEVTGKDTQGIVDGKYEGWKAKFEEHPYLKEKLDEAFKTGDFSKVPSSDIRKYNEFFTLNPNNRGRDGITDAKRYNVEVDSKFKYNENVVSKQGELIYKQFTGEITAKQAQSQINEYVKLAPSETIATAKNNNTTFNGVKFSKNDKVSNKKVLDNMSEIDKAMDNARKLNAPVKKIRVFDFDDTLARSKSQVIYEMPDGTTGKLNATQFAERAGELQAEGATFDFSEFSKVIEGKKGPLFEVAKKINEARGNEDLYILTARPADAAGPIYEFMKANGIEFKQENIIGLGDGTAAAKGRWITSKAAEGYNDFYFADDAIKNVAAVKDALSVFDVKSKVQQAKVKFSKNIDAEFNKILEDKSGIGAEKEYSRAKAEVVGKKLRLPRFVPYSAQDFAGLLYSTLSSGKKGEQQLQWYEETLFKPFSRAMTNLDRARVSMASDYKALKKGLGIVPKNLRKKITGDVFTNEQAVRVYIWNKQGMEVPGISKTDLKDLTKHVIDNPELQVFADQLIAIQKGREYAKPGEGWLGGTITTDLLEGLNTGRRAEYLQEWQANADIVFSEKNLNKLEAIYGKKYRKAIENSLRRMKTGRNKSYSDDSLTARFTDWLNGSIGVTMFLNTRSAILQTLSATNFVNFSDNNPYKAGKAFANQPQYWKDFMYLFNSDFLKSRRGGLRMDVTESDIADMAKKGGPKAVVGKILQFGFTPTQMADSFAIASGGATFYRNRINTYKKQGLSQAEAEAKAFEDFRDTAEVSQQSSRPDLISQQQAGPLGRPILAYSNTPAQYTRIMDKAVRDLVAGRGDAKTNISKIIYYGTAQNLIFNALQQGLFALAFGDEDPEEEEKVEKYVDVANGMADSVLRGTGLGGAAISVGKNAVLRIMREMEKDQPKLEKVGYELTKISPPVSSKLSKINQAARAYQWDKDEMMEKGLSLDNPAYLAGANVIAATTNIPLDRAIKKVNNVIQSTESDLETWERLALLGGWQDWQIGIEEEEKEKAKKPKPKTIKRKTVKRRIITR